VCNIYMYCVFALFFFVLCTLCCQYLWLVHFWLPLWCSLTCMSMSSWIYVSITDVKTYDSRIGVKYGQEKAWKYQRGKSQS
jgi:hypothetical protein